MNSVALLVRGNFIPAAFAARELVDEGLAEAAARGIGMAGAKTGGGKGEWRRRSRL